MFKKIKILLLLILIFSSCKFLRPSEVIEIDTFLISQKKTQILEKRLFLMLDSLEYAYEKGDIEFRNSSLRAIIYSNRVPIQYHYPLVPKICNKIKKSKNGVKPYLPFLIDYNHRLLKSGSGLALDLFFIIADCVNKNINKGEEKGHFYLFHGNNPENMAFFSENLILQYSSLFFTPLAVVARPVFTAYPRDLFAFIHHKASCNFCEVTSQELEELISRDITIEGYYEKAKNGEPTDACDITNKLIHTSFIPIENIVWSKPINEIFSNLNFFNVDYELPEYISFDNFQSQFCGENQLTGQGDDGGAIIPVNKECGFRNGNFLNDQLTNSGDRFSSEEAVENVEELISCMYRERENPYSLGNLIKGIGSTIGLISESTSCGASTFSPFGSECITSHKNDLTGERALLKTEKGAFIDHPYVLENGEPVILEVVTLRGPNSYLMLPWESNKVVIYKKWERVEYLDFNLSDKAVIYKKSKTTEVGIFVDGNGRVTNRIKNENNRYKVEIEESYTTNANGDRIRTRKTTIQRHEESNKTLFKDFYNENTGETYRRYDTNGDGNINNNDEPSELVDPNEDPYAEELSGLEDEDHPEIETPPDVYLPDPSKLPCENILQDIKETLPTGIRDPETLINWGPDGGPIDNIIPEFDINTCGLSLYEIECSIELLCIDESGRENCQCQGSSSLDNYFDRQSLCPLILCNLGATLDPRTCTCKDGEGANKPTVGSIFPSVNPIPYMDQTPMIINPKLRIQFFK